MNIKWKRRGKGLPNRAKYVRSANRTFNVSARWSAVFAREAGWLALSRWSNWELLGVILELVARQSARDNEWRIAGRRKGRARRGDSASRNSKDLGGKNPRDYNVMEEFMMTSVSRWKVMDGRLRLPKVMKGDVFFLTLSRRRWMASWFPNGSRWPKEASERDGEAWGDFVSDMWPCGGFRTMDDVLVVCRW